VSKYDVTKTPLSHGHVGWNSLDNERCLESPGNFVLGHADIQPGLYYCNGMSRAPLIPSDSDAHFVHLVDLAYERSVRENGLTNTEVPSVSYRAYTPWVADALLAEYKRFVPESRKRMISEEWVTSNSYVDFSSVFERVERTGVPRHVTVRFIYPAQMDELKEQPEDGQIDFIVAKRV
jgi:hypothetical protein